MDVLPPDRHDDEEPLDREPQATPRGRDRFDEAVGDAWESGLRRDRYLDEML